MRQALSWVLLLGSVVGLAITLPMWLKDKITDRAMIGLTLALSWLALSYAAITALFVTQ